MYWTEARENGKSIYGGNFMKEVDARKDLSIAVTKIEVEGTVRLTLCEAGKPEQTIEERKVVKELDER